MILVETYNEAPDYELVLARMLQRVGCVWVTSGVLIYYWFQQGRESLISGHIVSNVTTEHPTTDIMEFLYPATQ